MICVVVKEFPKAAELNSVLYDRVCANLTVKRVGMDEMTRKQIEGGEATEFDFHLQNFKEVDELTSWIKYILPDVTRNFGGEKGIPPVEGFDHTYGYSLQSFNIVECWGAHYNLGKSIIEHNHFPFTLSFIYYVRTPKGSAPIMIEGEPHNVKEGQCIFFLASQYHSVGPNDCDGRCAIVGNILYKL